LNFGRISLIKKPNKQFSWDLEAMAPQNQSRYQADTLVKVLTGVPDPGKVHHRCVEQQSENKPAEPQTWLTVLELMNNHIHGL
jgi:hypothetical protein